MERPDILGQREATIDDAPAILSSDEAYIWVNGFNTARDRLLGHTDALRAEIDRLREEVRSMKAHYEKF